VNDYYDLLGVPRDASRDEIQTALQRHLREVAVERFGVSPDASDEEVASVLNSRRRLYGDERDLEGDEQDRFNERLAALTEAAQTLADPTRRAAYDADLDGSASREGPGSDLYSVLGVTPDASPEEIRDAYYRRLRVDDTDIDTDTATARTKELREAYEVLSDPALRRGYNASQGIWWTKPAPFGAPEAVVEKRPLNPVSRATRNLPRGWRVTIDWIVTIVGAIAIVLAIKAWVINPYRIPSSSMEPTLHCARPGSGCESRFSDRVLANRFIYHFRKPHRGDIIVFKTPPLAKQRCGAGGTFVKRLIALPGERWEEKNGFIFINGKKLIEPYVKPDRRDTATSYPERKIPKGMYFMMGDNRTQSCDSREWGPVPRKNLIGEVFAVYWPPQRIGFR
jgi:signal peptidase I